MWRRSSEARISCFLQTAFGWVAFVVGCLVWATLVFPVGLVLVRIKPQLRYRVVTVTGAMFAFYVRILPFLAVRVERPRARGSRPRILVVNHQSWLDSVVMIGLERDVCGPARRYLFRVPGVRSFLDFAGFYAIGTDEPAPLDQMQSCVEDVLLGRRCMLFFPEGTRSRSGDIGAFRRGAFRMAVDYGLAIQPVVIDGLYDVLPRGRIIAQRANRYPVQVRYLELLEPPYGEGSRRAVVRALAERVRSSMVRELASLRSERRHTSRS